MKIKLLSSLILSSILTVTAVYAEAPSTEQWSLSCNPNQISFVEDKKRFVTFDASIEEPYVAIDTKLMNIDRKKKIIKVKTLGFTSAKANQNLISSLRKQIVGVDDAIVDSLNKLIAKQLATAGVTRREAHVDETMKSHGMVYRTLEERAYNRTIEEKIQFIQNIGYTIRDTTIDYGNEMIKIDTTQVYNCNHGRIASDNSPSSWEYIQPNTVNSEIANIIKQKYNLK